MLKMEKEYLKEYGDIPKDDILRYQELLHSVSLKKSNKEVFEECNRISNIKWNKLSFIIYLVPKATPRPRLGKSGVFYVSGAADNKRVFQNYVINREDITLITTPTKFTCTSYFPIPKSMNSVEKLCAELGFIYPTSKPDWDNVGKAYCDMLQGLILYDDSLVVEGISKKRYSTKPRIEITVEYMNEYDSVYNMRKIKKKG